MKTTAAIALALSRYAFALNEAPMITAAARLAPRDTDPLLVGYISENGGYSNPRSCDPTETVSTSGAYFQCCPTGGAASACNFYTTCSDNTLYGAGGSVDCFVNPGLQCNTGIVMQSAGGDNGASYLACWQTSLGTGAFTLVQTTGEGGGSGSGAASTGSGSGSGSSAAATASSTRSGSSGSSSGSAAQSTGTGASGSSSASASQSANSADVVVESIGGRVLGAVVALVAPWLL